MQKENTNGLPATVNQQVFTQTCMWSHFITSSNIYIHMKGRVNKRMDQCVQVLLTLTRDKGFERLVKLEKGKVSGRIKTIQQRHQTSRTLDTKLVTDIGNSTWQVESSDNTTDYTVTKELSNCPHQCFLRCSECDICVHLHTRTCMDYLIRSTICKHIHLIVRYSKIHFDVGAGKKHTRTSCSMTIPDCQHDTEALLKSLQSKDNTDDINIAKTRIRNKYHTSLCKLINVQRWMH